MPLRNQGYEVLLPPKLAAFARSCSDVNGATSRPQQTTTNAAQLPTTLPSLGPGGVGHGRTSRPCNPVSARRTQGLANASETQKSRLRRPARGFLCRAAAPPGCRCSPQGAWGTVRRRHEPNLRTRGAHGGWEHAKITEGGWWVGRADQGELTKLPGIATFSSLVSLGVVHDQQRAPYDPGT